MGKGDLQQVNLILSKSFTHARLQNGFQAGRVPLCRNEFLEMYLSANPEGSFVIERENRIIAYCFCHLWGTVGWIGPLSVIPSEEGQGYGKEVVLAAVDVLKNQGAETIGLEMPAYSNRNLAFYTKLGFIPGMLTVDFMRKASAVTNDKCNNGLAVTKLSELSFEHKQEFMDKVKNFSNQFQPGLDYSREIKVTTEFGFGDALIFSEADKICGFIIAHTEPYSTEENRQFLKTNVLQMSSELPVSTLDCFLQELEDWAQAEQLAGIYMRVPTRFTEGYKYILSKNFTIVNTELRMTLKGYSQKNDSGQINFSKWE